ncbi:MFS transporter [Crocinitomix catalasitica]|uniref:MFS transporter n=1 Tax=Crocinitomix catalasitica TaxID=184607 RepID=UPI000480BFD7|nr:MFS transporter [Crocinitomix catalasitica]
MKQLTSFYINSFKDLSKEVWWLALVTLINRAGTMVIPFLSLYLTESLSYSLSDVGWIMSSFGVGSVVGSWIGGKMADKIGAYKTMVFSLILSGFIFIGLQYITTFIEFCIGVFVLMVVADMFRPALFVALKAYSKPQNKTRSVTLIRLAINLGFSAGPAIGGLIIVKLGYGGLFWIDGISCIIAGFLLMNVLNPKRAIAIDETIVEHPKSAYTDKKYWLFIGATILFAIGFLQFFSTIPLYYKGPNQLSELEIGLLFAGNGFLIFLFEMPLIKWLEDAKKSAVLLILIGVIFIALSFLVMNLTDWVGILIISMLLITIGEMIAFPFSNSFAMERANRGKQGEYMALYSIAFSIAHIFSHNLGLHLVEDYGFAVSWYFFAGLSLLSVFFLFLLHKTK